MKETVVTGFTPRVQVADGGHLSTQRMVMFGGLNDWLATVTVMQTEQIISFLLQQDPAATSHWFWKS